MGVIDYRRGLFETTAALAVGRSAVAGPQSGPAAAPDPGGDKPLAVTGGSIIPSPGAPPADLEAAARTGFAGVNTTDLWRRSDAGIIQTMVTNDSAMAGNTSRIVVESKADLAYGVYQSNAFNQFQGFNNSGSIFAFTQSSWAFGIQSHQLQPVITNSGLIAAQATTGHARGIQVGDSTIINTSTGRILAEGRDAIAIEVAGAGTLNNAGLIQANSSDPDYFSVGVLADHIAVRTYTINNTGIIRADIAILGGPYEVYPPQAAAQLVNNEATGLIDGLIYLDLGDDVVTNRGRITGDVYMGEGADRVDTSAGALNGLVDMGWGDDQFVGSTGQDIVLGNRDSDTLEGRNGDDMLLGGLGADVLIGGAGNDGLFGEYGADRIVTQGADYVDAGAGEDRIELGDYAFEVVAGGDGFDTLVLPSGPRNLDLTAVANAGRVFEFEAIEMRGGQTVALRAGDVSRLADGATEFRILATATDHVNLIGAWTQDGDQNVGGVLFHSYASGDVHVLVQAAAIVAVQAAAGVGAGLDSIGSGDLAPIPVDDLLASTTTVVDVWDLHSNLVIGAEETWTTSDKGGLFELKQMIEIQEYVSLTNYGTMLAQTNYSAEVVRVYFATALNNYGLIRATGSNIYGALGVDCWGACKIFNAGHIEAIAYGEVSALRAMPAGTTTFENTVLNTGWITARSVYTTAEALNLQNPMTMENQGTIEAYGGTIAYGIRASRESTIVNSGAIYAQVTEGTGKAWGAYV